MDSAPIFQITSLKDSLGKPKLFETPPIQSPVLLDPDGDVTITLLYRHTGRYGDPKTTFQFAPLQAVFKVSQKHMVLASPHARMVLQGIGKEGTTIYPDGTKHWKIDPLFDRDAFELVLRIIHGSTEDVPAKLTLEKLAHVAAVVDDLQCEKSISFFAKAWIQQLKDTMPDQLGPDLGRCILISSVFQDQEMFSKSTKTAILVSSGSSFASNLPIRPPILDMIESRRKAALDEILSAMTTTRSALIESRPLFPDACDFQCRCALIGGLAIAMASIPWIISTPGREAVKHDKTSVRSAAEDLKKMKSPTHHEFSFSGPVARTPCSLERYFGPGRVVVVARVEGLRLDDFVATKKPKQALVVVPT